MHLPLWTPKTSFSTIKQPTEEKEEPRLLRCIERAVNQIVNVHCLGVIHCITLVVRFISYSTSQPEPYSQPSQVTNEAEPMTSTY